MKTNIIALFVGMLLISTIFTTANIIQSSTFILSDNPKQMSLGDDVPQWEQGDYWTYQIDVFDVNFSQDNQTVLFHLETNQLPLTVTEVRSDEYVVSYSTTFSGNGEVYLDSGEGPINATIDFTDIDVSGSIVFEKTMLGITSFDMYLDGRFMIHIYEQPYNIPFSLENIPVPLQVDVNIDFDPSFSLLRFPLEEGLVWNLSATTFTVNGEVRSIWLRLLYVVDIIANILSIEFLPDDVAAMLPNVDIKTALEYFELGNMFSVPELPYAFICQGLEPITVIAGTYDAYNISIAGGVASCHFAPSAGNIVQIAGDFSALIPYISDINIELIETNFS